MTLLLLSSSFARRIHPSLNNAIIQRLNCTYKKYISRTQCCVLMCCSLAIWSLVYFTSSKTRNCKCRNDRSKKLNSITTISNQLKIICKGYKNWESICIFWTKLTTYWQLHSLLTQKLIICGISAPLALGKIGIHTYVVWKFSTWKWI